MRHTLRPERRHPQFETVAKAGIILGSPGAAYPNVHGGACCMDDISANKRLYFPGYDTTPGYHNKYLAYADLPADW